MEQLRRPLPTSSTPETTPSGAGASAAPAAGHVLVSSGAMTESFELGGLSVEDARTLLARAYNLDPQAEATVNGNAPTPGQRLQAGDHLDFSRLIGEKGGVT